MLKVCNIERGNTPVYGRRRPNECALTLLSHWLQPLTLFSHWLQPDRFVLLLAEMRHRIAAKIYLPLLQLALVDGDLNLSVFNLQADGRQHKLIIIIMYVDHLI